MGFNVANIITPYRNRDILRVKQGAEWLFRWKMILRVSRGSTIASILTGWQAGSANIKSKLCLMFVLITPLCCEAAVFTATQSS